MKVILFMAMSINGIIAREYGSEDFFSDRNWEEFVKIAEDKKCIIVGRKTYELVSRWKKYNFDSLKNVKKIIVSSKNPPLQKKDYFYTNSPKEAIKLA
ncbi:MAG: dihydrofolate reductase family protein, partial [Nanoarchaeota archaeon]